MSLLSREPDQSASIDQEPEGNGVKSSERRYLVIGSSGYRGVDSLEWDSDSLPNIVDYDTVIVDVRSLNQEKLKLVSHGLLVNIRTQLVRLLDSNGQVIVLTDFRRTDHRPDSYPERFNNYDWCPIAVGISDESGETVVKQESRFEVYLHHMKDWPYYLFIPNSCLSRELTNYYGSTYDTRYKVSMLPFLTNRYGKTLAGTCRIEVRHQVTKSDRIGFSTYKTYPTEPDTVTGELVLLPLLPEFDPKQAVALILEDLIGSPVRAEFPDWAEAIIVPGVEQIADEIGSRRKKITEIFSEIEQLDKQRRELDDFRRLQFATGADLEDVLSSALAKLGGKIVHARYAEEEYILEFEGSEYLIEVKGVSKSITLGHLRQLNDYLLKYEEDTGSACKGILFGNAWRNDPPDERGTNEKPEFPDNVIKRATQWQIALVSSTAFFSSFCSFINDESLGKAILQRITATDGIVDLTPDTLMNKEI